jgi:predicted Zn-dependent protease
MVERWQATALPATPDSPELQFTVALFRQFQGRSAESVNLFRQLLANGADPLLCLNNLAWSTCEGLDSPAEALSYVQQAIDRFGLVPALLDTRGVILTNLGRYDQAIADLTESAAHAQSPSAGYLKLARAYLVCGRKDAARAAKERISPNGTAAPALRQNQRIEYEQLVAQLTK